jgi:hypothetical protein
MAIVLVADQLWGTLSDKLSRRLSEPPRRRRCHAAIALNGDEMGQQTSTMADHMLS